MNGTHRPDVSLGSFVDRLRRWYGANASLLGNTLSLAGTTASTSLLGLVFWAVAARMFSAKDVGAASAAVSLMLLLGFGGMIGLGTLLINELPRRRSSGGPMLTTALITGAAAAVVLWLCVELVAQVAGGIFPAESTSLLRSATFAVGVALTTSTSILDWALIGLLRGGVQLWRNVSFAGSKLLLLPALALLLVRANEGTILLSWVVGLALSLAVVAVILLREGHGMLYRPHWRWLGNLGGETLKHHVLNLSISGSRMLLPVLAASLVSAKANAAFYVAWMLVGMGLMIPTHFSTVLQAVGNREPDRLAERLRFSLRLSLLLGATFTIAIALAAPLFLDIFGSYYRHEAVLTLRILALAVCPLAYKLHFVAVGRVRLRVGRTAIQMLMGGMLEVGLAALGAMVAGIDGLAAGFVAAVIVQAVLTYLPLRRLQLTPKLPHEAALVEGLEGVHEGLE